MCLFNRCLLYMGQGHIPLAILLHLQLMRVARIYLLHSICSSTMFWHRLTWPAALLSCSYVKLGPRKSGARTSMFVEIQ